MAIFPITDQYKHLGKGPLDAKSLVKTYADLTSVNTWTIDGQFIAYNGMVVAVWLNKVDTSKNGIYFLYDASVTTALEKPNVTKEANWHKLAEVSESDIKDRLLGIEERVAALEGAESSTPTYESRKLFPATGEPNKLYIAADEKKTYAWINDQYYVVGGSEYEEPSIIVLRNDGSSEWASSTYKLHKGELGISYLDNGNVIVKAGDGEKLWAELPQVESVLESDMVLTHSFGKHKPATGSCVNAGGEGMTMTQWIADALKETVEPTIKRYPDVELSGDIKTLDTGNKEIGSYITAVSYSAALSEDGDYETNGKETASGIKASDVAWEVTLGDATSTKKTTTTGEYTTNIQINSTSNKTYATIKAKATLNLDNVVTPTNNLGEASSTIKISGFDVDGVTVKNIIADVKATGYRDTWYYIGTDCTTEIDSAFIRGSTSKGSTTYNFGTVTIPAGTTRVMFAVFGNKTLTSVIDVDGMGLDVKENFTKKTIAVSGANDFEAASYSVFIAENPSGMAATRYTVTIS